MSVSEQYFRCGGCGRFVAYENMQKHYESNHKEGIAVESPPAPATVSNPPPMPMVRGQIIPPATPEIGGFGNLVMNILLMRRSYPKAFVFWTIIVWVVSMLFTSNLFAWLVFHI
jgi:hypothetical protein